MDTKEKIASAGLAAAIITGWKSEWLPMLKSFVDSFWNGLTPWRFGFVLSIGYLLWWWIDRIRLKRVHWVKEARSTTEIAVLAYRSDLTDMVTRSESRLTDIITSFEARLEISRVEWARQLRCIVEDEVRHIMQAEAKARADADALINRRLDEIENGLPHIGVS